MELIDPTGRPATSSSATRLESLTGVPIGVLENRKTNARELLGMVAEILQRDWGAGDCEIQDKQVFSQPAAADLVEGLAARNRLVLTGIGD